MSVKRREGVFNPNRRILAPDALPRSELDTMADRASYGGNPEHKLHPGDYGFGALPHPRPGKMLCDAEGPFGKSQAESLLKAAFRKGMVSRQTRGDWPQNVWAVTTAGVPYEAQLENRDQGTYHGYPMAADDVFRSIVLKEWAKR
ncbi:hypothetical protein [Azospirillum sp. SYSU D00513]|uniref:hypothetical protein n=1 Tax=Azospirillum sp. SYSU D00513 TaxID=2812561 RepID=UPI001A974E65|nr:hypothetical protein [Azospirillum sp. SYSU D00513]